MGERYVDMNKTASPLDKLPRACVALLPTTGEPTLIEKGTMGYCPLYPDTDPVEMNRKMGVNDPRVIEAMKAGSFFGWDVPAVDIDHERYKELPATLEEYFALTRQEINDLQAR